MLTSSRCPDSRETPYTDACMKVPVTVGVGVGGADGGVAVLVAVMVGVREGKREVALGPDTAMAVGSRGGAAQAASTRMRQIGVRDANWAIRCKNMQ